MAIILLGVNHNTAPVEIREKLAISDHAIPEFSKEIVKTFDLKEFLILSTCNRTEFYAIADDPGKTLDNLSGFFSRHFSLNSNHKSLFYRFSEKEALQHLFKVACGIDSMVIGECQILSQVKSAFGIAQEQNTTGKILNKLLNIAIRTGKKARTDTRISQGASSISFVAVELAKRIFGELSNTTVLIIGAGKMSELTLKLLIQMGVKVVMVANRTFEKAKEMAEAFDGKAINFDELPDNLRRCDIIISSTAAPHYVIKKNQVEEAMRQRKNRPLFIIDIAVPRDIDPEVEKLRNVYLYNIDDLRNVLDYNLEERGKEIEKVEEIIENSIREFDKFYKSSQADPLIKELIRRFDEIREENLAAEFSRNSYNDVEKERMEKLSRNFMQKLLHSTISQIKEVSMEEGSEEKLALIRRLFVPEKR